jgi:hypothetical protein
MKKLNPVMLAVLVSLTACSTTKDTTNRADLAPVKVEASTPAVKETKLSTDFTDEGIKIFYTSSGELEKVEVTGQANAWKSNVEAIAEADALAKLVKFVYGNDVSTNRKVSILGKAIENAEDSGTNTAASGGTINSNAKELEMQLDKDKNNKSSSATSQRTAKVITETLTETVNEMSSKGRLVGVRKVKDSIKDEGKVYQALYIWSAKDMNTANFIRNKMQMQ